jgi:hypothetical protein
VPRAAWLSRRRTAPSRTATQVALQFVADVYAGGRPSIEAALDEAPPAEWAGLLRALLIAEVNARRARGEVPTARDYLARFPAHTAIVRTILPELPPPAPDPPPLAAGQVGYPESPAELVRSESDPPTAASAQAASVEPPVAEVPTVSRPPRARRRRRWVGGAILMMAAVLAAVLPRLMPVDGPTPTPPPAPAPVPKPAPKVVPKVAPTDPERDLAEWVLGLGGHGTVLPKTSSRRLFSAEAPLPKNRFAVTAVVLPPEAAGRWTPADLERLRGRDKLSALELHSASDLTEAALSPLAGSPLRTVELDAPVRAPGQFFASFTDLEWLALPHAPDFSDADLAALSGLARLSALSINSPKLTLKGFEGLQCPALRSLTLGPDVAVTPDYVRVLQRLPLEQFECAAEMTDDAFIEFALFPEMRRVRLHHAPLTDSALRAVIGLGKLEEFRAIGTSVTGPGLEHVAERKGLRVLDLTGARLTNDSLGPLLGMPALKELRLAGNPITDDGAFILAQLDGIETLDLGETGLTDAALRALAKHLTLKTLIATQTRVTAAGVRDFEAQTPGCKVVYGKRN